MNNITVNLHHVLEEIRQTEYRFHRPSGSVLLLAVSKFQSVEAIAAAFAAGQKAFGENYCQEALNKMWRLQDKNIEWHFIGALQSNKTQAIAENFSWVHSLDRVKIAERLDRQRPSDLPPLNVCIAVNISQENNKTGVAINEVADFARLIQQLPRLCLRGLMAMPKPQPDFDEQLKIYRSVQILQETLVQQGFPLDTLSMGTSNDYQAAIAAGSTIVRIGTAIFGPRSDPRT